MKILDACTTVKCLLILQSGIEGIKLLAEQEMLLKFIKSVGHLIATPSFELVQA